jgi:hypothetical protein
VPQKSYKLKQVQYRKKTYVDEDLNFFVGRNNQNERTGKQTRPVTKTGLKRVANPLMKYQKQHATKLPLYPHEGEKEL